MLFFSFPKTRSRLWRGFLPLMLLAMLAMVGPAFAQAASSVAAVTGASKPAEPAKTAPTIIPGSPLAALTGATHAPGTTPPPQSKAPFGTQSIGFALDTAFGRGTINAFNDFISALKRSTQLAPVIRWSQSVNASPYRRAEAVGILAGLGVAIVPGVILDAVIAFLLRPVAGFLVKRAVPKEDEYLFSHGTNGVRSLQIPLRLTLRGWLRRFGYAFLKFLLRLVPLAAFLIFVLLILSSDLITNRAAHLAVTGIANAYIAARLVQEIFRFLISPRSPNLRLIRMPTPYAMWATRRVKILLITIVVSFCLISGAEILDLSEAGASVLTRFAGLIVHLELGVWIWQSRRVVSRWIAGRLKKQGLLAGIRQRFAKVWYIFALCYLVAMWIAWAAGVHNALAVILRSILVIIGALLLVRLLWVGCNRLLKRLFPDEDEDGVVEGSVRAFRKRFMSYNQLIRVLGGFFFAVFALVLVLQGWGIDAFSWILVNPIGRALMSTVLNVLATFVGAILVWEFANYLLERQIERFNSSGRTRQATRLSTLSPMLRAALAVVVVMLALIIGLSRIGVNTAGLLAVSSVVGIAVAFGSQKLVQDVITGLFLLFEDAMQVGDSITLAGMSGTVERLSIRTIRLRGGDGSVNIIPFSSVSTVTNQTRDFSIAQLSIMVGYQENIDQVVALLKDIGTEMRAEPAWGVMIRDDLQVFGLDSFGELGLVITGQIRTGPGQHASVRREFQARVQKRFLESGIELPYRHQTLQLEVPAGAREAIRHDLAASGVPGNKNPTG